MNYLIDLSTALEVTGGRILNIEQGISNIEVDS